MKKLFTINLFLLVSLFTFSQIINIPADYPTIQEGIDAASNGDTVLVDTGTYFENINFIGKNITVASHYLTTQDKLYISLTVIDGDSTSTVVTFENGEDSTALLIGFTIMDGWKEGDHGGGGIYCYHSSPELSHLIIKDNEVTIPGWKEVNDWEYFMGYGGGILLMSSSSSLNNLIIRDNKSGIGGGIYCDSSNITIHNSKFTNNRSVGFGFPRDGGWGGAIGCVESTLTLTNALIDSNIVTGNSRGGGIASGTSKITIINSRFSADFALSGAGDAIWSYSNEFLDLYNVLIENSHLAMEVRYGLARVVNSTFVSNEVGILLGHWATIESYNSIFWDNDSCAIKVRNGFHDNDITISYSNIEQGQNGVSINNGGVLHWLEGNIDQDPMFIGSSEHPYQINDYSPCIDVGTPDTTGLNLPEYDLAGEIRIFNDRIDMGAYEWNTFVDIEEAITYMEAIESQVCPNPFTASTTLSYELQQPEKVSLSVYNHLGQIIYQTQETQPLGKHQLIWNAENMPDGIYYYRLQVGDAVANGKMMKVR